MLNECGCRSRHAPRAFAEQVDSPPDITLSHSFMKVLRKRRRFLLWELSVLVRVCLQANSHFRANIRLQAGSHETGICESQNAAVKSCFAKQRNPPACQPGVFRTSLSQTVGQQCSRHGFHTGRSKTLESRRHRAQRVAATSTGKGRGLNRTSPEPAMPHSLLIEAVLP